MPVRIRGFIRFQAKKHEDPTATHTKPVYVYYNRLNPAGSPPAPLGFDPHRISGSVEILVDLHRAGSRGCYMSHDPCHDRGATLVNS